MSFTVGAPPAVMMSPQSPVASAFVKLTAAAPLQQAAAVELVVEDVDVVDELEVDEVDELEVEDVEVEDVELLDDELLDDELLDDELLLVLLVDDDDVDEVDVDEVDVDELDDEDVVVVPWTGHPPGAGASFRLKIVDWFLMVWPPNSAQ